MNDITALAQRMKDQTVKAPYYLAECTHCGEMFPSNLLNGGEPLFAGDYNDCRCPHCNTDDSLIADLGAGEEMAVAAWNFQQKRIDSLVEALEKAQTERDEFRNRLKLERAILEDADKRIAELEREKVAHESVEMALRDDMLESRTVTVKLPEEAVDQVCLAAAEIHNLGNGVSDDKAQFIINRIRNYLENGGELTAAGIQVIEGEGQ